MKKKFKYDIEKEEKNIKNMIPSAIVACSVGFTTNLLFALSKDLHLVTFGGQCALVTLVCFIWDLCCLVLFLVHLALKKKAAKKVIDNEDK